ncbi:MAG: PDZ domain-containing protein, partial [Candidatus Binatia bacterium]
DISGDVPAPGSGLYYLIRTRECGSWQTARGSELFNLRAERGVLVADVESGGTASKAGFQRGDIITNFNGKTINDVGQLESFLKKAQKPGKIKMKIQRNGKPVTVLMNLPS